MKQAATGIQHVCCSDCNFHLMSLKSNFPWVNSVASIIIYPNNMNCIFSNKFPDIAYTTDPFSWYQEKLSVLIEEKKIVPQYNEEILDVTKQIMSPHEHIPITQKVFKIHLAHQTITTGYRDTNK